MQTPSTWLFQPSCWVTGRAWAFRPLQERASPEDLMDFFSEIKVCVCFISSIKSLFTKTTQRNIQEPDVSQLNLPAMAVSNDGNALHN